MTDLLDQTSWRTLRRSRRFPGRRVFACPAKSVPANVWSTPAKRGRPFVDDTIHTSVRSRGEATVHARLVEAIVRVPLAGPQSGPDEEQKNEDPARKPDRDHHVGRAHRSEEHTSELQSLRHLVCRLLL